MYGTASDERAVKVPASEAWKLIGTLQLAYFIEQSLPHLISKIDVVQGDGSTGTILHATFPPGSYFLYTYIYSSVPLNMKHKSFLVHLLK